MALIACGPGLDETLANVESAGSVGCSIPADVFDADSVETAAEAAERELGPIDVWVNDVTSPGRRSTGSKLPNG